MDIGSFPHQVTRLVFDTGQPYEEFRARYEAAAHADTAEELAKHLTGALTDPGPHLIEAVVPAIV